MMIENGVYTMTVHEDIAIRADIEILEQQEQLLRFTAFNAETAWQLGTLLRSELLTRNAPATVEIEVNQQLLFACTTPNAQPGQADWIRRKRNAVRRFARSSYLSGRILARDNETIEARHGLTLTDYAVHGGGFPIHLTGTGSIGTAIISGLPQREDHKLLTNALATILGITIPQLD
jgi:uncharacterized protein (UPF0303 family)